MIIHVFTISTFLSQNRNKPREVKVLLIFSETVARPAFILKFLFCLVPIRVTDKFTLAENSKAIYITVPFCSPVKTLSYKPYSS